MRPRAFLTADLPSIAARFREAPEDFEVEEVPAYPASGVGTHTYITIEKRGVSTLEAVRRIAARLGRHPDEIGFAGLKDARAVARQRISIEHLRDDERTKIDDEHVRALAFERHSNKIRKGHLRGNVFRVALRGATAEDERAARATIERLARGGAANYFGMQRFGGARAMTHRLGFALLRERWDELLALLLGGPGTDESPRVREARARYEAGDSAGALAAFPPTFRAERAALRALIEGGDSGRAVAAIPREERTLYANAAQAAIFNDLLTERIERGALGQLEPGDVAFIHAKGACFLVEDPGREQARADELEISPAGPLFGAKLLFARGAPAEREAAALAAAGLSIASFDARLAGRPAGARKPYRILLGDPAIALEGDTLRLSFFLPAGSYATAVVAELLKRDVA